MKITNEERRSKKKNANVAKEMHHFPSLGQLIVADLLCGTYYCPVTKMGRRVFYEGITYVR